jgi:hypothetical protein
VTRAELLLELDERQRSEAQAWAIVTVDPATGAVLDAVGPFAEPEQAFLQAGQAAAEWGRYNPGEPAFRYDIVPLWWPAP